MLAPGTLHRPGLPTRSGQCVAPRADRAYLEALRRSRIAGLASIGVLDASSIVRVLGRLIHADPGGDGAGRELPRSGVMNDGLTSSRIPSLYPFRHARKRGALKSGQGRIEKSELTSSQNGCKRRATVRRRPPRREHRRRRETPAGCGILQRRRGVLQQVAARGDADAGGGRDARRVSRRELGATPRCRDAIGGPWQASCRSPRRATPTSSAHRTVPSPLPAPSRQPRRDSPRHAPRRAANPGRQDGGGR